MKMKKIGLLLMAFMLVFSLAACGSDSDSGSGQQSQQEQATVEKDLPDGDYSDMGEGMMYLSTAGGTSEDGNVPVIYVEDTIILQIGLDTEGFDGSLLSYVYVDGMENCKEQLSDSQTSIDLQGDALAEGIHKVEVVQYADNDTSGEMLTYKTASYEVKAK